MSSEVKSVTIGGDLSIEDVINVSRNNYKVSISQEAMKKVISSYEELKKISDSNNPVYGVNTGFGTFSKVVLDSKDLCRLSHNIIKSHAVASGSYLPNDVVKAAMLVRLNSFLLGHSGVSPLTVNTILEMINKNVIPLVPSKGSLSSCGDLALLSHTFIVMIKQDSKDEYSGEVFFNNEKLSGTEAMTRAGISQINLSPKEGLSLTNGATFTVAYLSLLYNDIVVLKKAFNASLSLSMEGLMCVPNAFDSRIHNSRPHPGQIKTSQEILRLISGSKFVSKMNRVQDSYTIRCAPQVHGCLYDSLNYIEGVITTELNSATDNPLIFGKDIISGGNFHGQVLGCNADNLKVCLSVLCGISERRTAKLIDNSTSNGLPCMLVHKDANPGLDSGMMIPQYTSASLTMKNQTLCFPDSVMSLPTSANQEDYNANSWNSVLHLAEIVENAKQIVAIEAYNAKRAIDIRFIMEKENKNNKVSKMKLGNGTAQLFNKLSNISKYVPQDHFMNNDISRINQYLSSSEFSLLYDNLTKEVKNALVLEPASGCRDFHPGQMIIRNNIIDMIKNVYLKHGAKEIDTPVFERRDILIGQYGNNDVDKLIYNLTDDGVPLSLRYDLTVPFCRYIANNSVNSIKRFHIAKVYRRDNPSANQGRFREFYQNDFDYAGNSDIMCAETEVLTVMCEIYQKLDIGKFIIKLNDRRILEQLMNFCGVPKEKFNSACSSIDKLDKQDWKEISVELLSKGLETKTVEKIGYFMEIKGDADKVINRLKTEFSDNKELVKVLDEHLLLSSYLKAVDCYKYISFDLSLARGLGYYTGMIFEVFGIDSKVNSSLGAGGRYDKLVGQFSGKNIPAVGGSVGIERVFAIIEQKQQESKQKLKETITKVLVTSVGKDMFADVLSVAKDLWDANIPTEYKYKINPKMKDQIEYCADNEIPIMVIIGETEKQNKQVIVKIMSNDKDKQVQHTILRSQMVEFIKKIL